MRSISFLISLFLCLSGCSGLSKKARLPAEAQSAAESEDREKAAFYIAQLPTSQRDKSSLDASAIPQLMTDCAAGPYKDLVLPIQSKSELANRFKILLQKLSRPFNFTMVYERDQPGYVLGSTSDFKEFVCIAAAMGNGSLAHNKVPIDFYVQILDYPNLTAPVLNMVLSAWNSDSRDLSLALKILNHARLDKYLAKDLIQYAFRSDFPVATRSLLAPAILRSRVYAENKLFLTSSLTNLLPVLGATIESLEFRKLLLTVARDSVNIEEFFRDSIRYANPETDYSALLKLASAGQDADMQVRLFLTLAASDAKYQNAEKDFSILLSQTHAGPVRARLFNYALNFDESSKRFSTHTIIETAKIALDQSKDESIVFAALVIALYRDKIVTVDDQRSLMSRVCEKPISTVRNTQLLIQIGQALNSKSKENEITYGPCVRSAALKFENDPTVLDLYSGYVNGLSTVEQKIAMGGELLAVTSVSDQFLVTLAAGVYHTPSESTLKLLAKILEHPSLSAQTLDQVSLMLQSHAGRLTEDEKSLLPLIADHRYATEAIKERCKLSLSNQWEPLKINWDLPK